MKYWNKFVGWYRCRPKNRFWFAIGAVAWCLIPLIAFQTKPSSIMVLAILLNGIVAGWYLHEWMKLQRGSKS